MSPLYRVVINVQNKELRLLFDGYWKENEAQISARLNIKGRKGKGGKQKSAQKIAESSVKPHVLYMGAIPNFLHSYLKNILFIESIEISQFNDEAPEEEAQVLALVYFFPELALKSGLNENFFLRMPESSKVEINEEQEWTNRQQELKSKHIAYKPVEGDLKETHQALLDVIASSESGPEDRLTFRGKWQGLQYPPKAVKAAILEHKIGDLFECEYEVPVSADEMKKIRSMIKIYDTREGVFPEIDDELAKKEGFESVEKMKESFMERYRDHVSNQQRAMIAEHVIHQILMNSTFSPFPLPWLRESLRRATEYYRNQVKDESKLFSMFGVKNMAQFEDQLKGELYRETLQQIALKFYAKTFNLDDSNQDVIFDDMVKRVEWVPEEKEEIKE